MRQKYFPLLHRSVVTSYIIYHIYDMVSSSCDVVGKTSRTLKKKKKKRKCQVITLKQRKGLGTGTKKNILVPGMYFKSYDRRSQKRDDTQDKRQNSEVKKTATTQPRKKRLTAAFPSNKTRRHKYSVEKNKRMHYKGAHTHAHALSRAFRLLRNASPPISRLLLTSRLMMVGRMTFSRPSLNTGI